jgi:uncharacterized protein DUF1835
VRRRLLAGPDYYTVPSDASAGPLPSGIHVVRGDSPAGALKSAGAKRIVPLPDNLAIGPSSRSVKLHPKIRERYWRMEYAAARCDVEDMTGATELLGGEGVARAVASGRAQPLVIWATGFWSDLLMLGWLLDSAGRRGGEWDRVALVGDMRATMPLGWLNPEQLFPFGRAAAPVSASLRGQLVEVWRAFTAPTPEHLERLHRTAPSALPTFLDGLGVYASLLPRRISSARRLRLPLVDEVLLRLVPTRRFVRFPELFKGASPSRARWPKAGLFSMLSYFGDLVVQARLATWSIGPNPAIQQIALPLGSDPGGRPYNTSWRLTERGRKLIADGLDGPEDCPEQLVGGYSSERAENWCCAITTTGWRLERW